MSDSTERSHYEYITALRLSVLMLFAGSTEAGAVKDECQVSGTIGNSAKLSLEHTEIAETPLPHQRQELANHERVSEKTAIQQRKGRGGGGREGRRVERNSGSASKSRAGDAPHHHKNTRENHIPSEPHPTTDTCEDLPTTRVKQVSAANDMLQQNQEQDEHCPNSKVRHSGTCFGCVHKWPILKAYKFPSEALSAVGGLAPP